MGPTKMVRRAVMRKELMMTTVKTVMTNRHTLKLGAADPEGELTFFPFSIW